jgi:hypothetical protein
MSPETLLTSLCATWLGEGVSEGKKVTDVLRVRRGKDGSTLIAEAHATTGDSFSASTELVHLVGTATFRAIERNNGKWPLREFTGSLRGQTLHLEEKTSERHVILRLTLVNATTVEVTESMVQAERVKAPFVHMIFKLDPSKGRCAA